MDVADLDLDAKGFDVYEAIYEHGGEATTTEIKEWTGIEKNAIVHYRMDKLEDQGLIEIGVGEASGNRTPPKLASLTETGQKLADDRLFDEAEPTIIERMDRVERRMKAVEGEFHSLQDEFRQWRYDEEEDREVDIRDILDRLEKFEALTEGVDDDALEEALAVADRVEDIEGTLTTKRKYFDQTRSMDRSGGSGRSMVEGRDVVVALQSLEAETEQLARSLKEAGIEPAESEEYIALNGGIWG